MSNFYPENIDWFLGIVYIIDNIEKLLLFCSKGKQNLNSFNSKLIIKNIQWLTKMLPN